MRYILYLFLLSFSLPAFCFDHSYSNYNKLLNTVVVEQGRQTVVDYDYLKKYPEILDSHLTEIETVSRQDFNSWNKNQQLAFLINAYNAFTLKLILNHYPKIESILDLGGLILFTPWKKNFFNLFGKEANLSTIENDLIRENYDEPRIHFAINCASKSCPALQKQAYVADKLEQQLENATIQFMRDPEHNRFNKEKKLLKISSIFNWYNTDFTKSGSLQSYIASYISEDPEIQVLLNEDTRNKNKSTGIGNLLNDNSVKIIYLDYDWSLNKL